MYLNGSGGLYLDGIMNQNLYEYIPSNQSKNAIINAMKVNLELKDEEPNKEFSFSADTPYEQKVIGKDLYGGVENPGRAPETNDTTSNCGENEELGADGKTCVCKFGYSKKMENVKKMRQKMIVSISMNVFQKVEYIIGMIQMVIKIQQNILIHLVQ